MSVGVEESYRYCRDVARRRARNFYYSFVLLPREQKMAMCAVYAFMRFCDDLSDEAGASTAAIDRWHEELDAALDGRMPDNPLWPAFCDTVARFRIPRQYFTDMIAGVRSDLEPRTIETFEDLYQYCYRVASVVGLTTIHIFGFESPEALPLAEKCGIAFQLTNILRDLREDEEHGRVYLPREDLRRFGVERMEAGENFRRLLRFEVERAREFYATSRPLLKLIHRRSRPSLWALIEIYRRLLDRIDGAGERVLKERVRVPAWEKVGILGRALLTGAE